MVSGKGKEKLKMSTTHNRMTPADALVIFGVTGDLAHKMIFPALYAMFSTCRW